MLVTTATSGCVLQQRPVALVRLGDEALPAAVVSIGACLAEVAAHRERGVAAAVLQRHDVDAHRGVEHSGFDPSFAVGGDLGEAGTNAHHGSGECFVAEADESDGSLLEYTPDVAVVTNIEADHLDFFGSAEAYGAVFDGFVERLKPGGALVVCTDDAGAAGLAERTAALGIRVLRYGSDPTQPPAGILLDWESRAPARSRTSSFKAKRTHG